MAAGYKAHKTYQNVNVQTSNQKQLILMLYDGMSRFMTKAIEAINQKDFESAHTNLSKVGMILLELLSTLREEKGGEIAQNLKKLYVFCYEQIVIANLKKDVSIIVDVRKILNNLRKGWADTGKMGIAQSSGSAIPQKLKITG